MSFSMLNMCFLFVRQSINVYLDILFNFFRSSVTIPSVRTNALNYGAFLGLYANLRYQLLCGFDRAMVNHFDVIGVPLVFSTILRSLSLVQFTFIIQLNDVEIYYFYAMFGIDELYVEFIS